MQDNEFYWCDSCNDVVETREKKDGFDYEYGSIRGFHEEIDIVCDCCGEPVDRLIELIPLEKLEYGATDNLEELIENLRGTTGYNPHAILCAVVIQALKEEQLQREQQRIWIDSDPAALPWERYYFQAIIHMQEYEFDKRMEAKLAYVMKNWKDAPSMLGDPLGTWILKAKFGSPEMQSIIPDLLETQMIYHKGKVASEGDKMVENYMIWMNREVVK